MKFRLTPGEVADVNVPPLSNNSGETLRLEEVRLGPSARGLRVNSVEAYNVNDTQGVAYGLTGVLTGKTISSGPGTPKARFIPHKVSEVVVTPHEQVGNWYVLVGIVAPHAGHYVIRSVIVEFEEHGHRLAEALDMYDTFSVS